MLASTALRDLIVGPTREGRILGTSSQATWVAVDEQVVVVGGRDSVQLPNGVVIDGVGHNGGSGTLAEGLGASADRFVAGDGAIEFGGRHLVPSRWWDPRPVLPPADRRRLQHAVAQLTSCVGHAPDPSLRDALARHAPDDVIDAAGEHLGRGTGLTPSGDDMLVGALSAFLLLGGALEDQRPQLLIDSVGPDLRRLAIEATTTLSAALIDHALNGQVALPVAQLLHTLVGHGPLDDAVDDLRAVGHSSGAALIDGVLTGASAVHGGPR